MSYLRTATERVKYLNKGRGVDGEVSECALDGRGDEESGSKECGEHFWGGWWGRRQKKDGTTDEGKWRALR